MPRQHTEQQPTISGAPALLLVDDETAFVETLSFRLATRGLPCLTAHSGEDALALLDRQELEVVLLDLNMPGMHGLEVLRLIKNKRPDIEVLLLTGDSNLAVAARGMRRGAGDYLVKPVDFDVLLESIQKARTRAQERKESLRASETVKLMALGALAAGVGHEINNPLQVIMQRSEWLCELTEEAESGRPDFTEMIKTANTIAEQARRCGVITAQLLELAHKTKHHKAETNLAALSAKVLDRIRERADALGVALVVEIAGNLPDLPCSPTEIEPVLSHLLKNALDGIEARLRLEQRFSGAEQVEIRAEMRTETAGSTTRAPAQPATAAGFAPAGGRIRLMARAGAKAVSIVIEDSGEGIAPEHLPHIYEPFFSTRPMGKGAGLGLTVCHSIITALRGNISYSPAAPAGAVFTVEIPMARDSTDTNS